MSTQLEKLQRKIPEEKDKDILEDCLEDAKCIILARRKPFGNWDKDENGNFILEDKFLSLQIQIAVEIYNKQGAEGETQHTENGVMRVWEKANVSENLLSQIVPLAQIISKRDIKYNERSEI
ncbi:phage head-tail connector protein [Anaerofustis stercorihominis]|uniref:phage head-tail connector protein n=1 Tax=Anaerofustis stercorihominis TaxID=214853 RepID=UPI00214C0C00|nr:phage head-tail connector protein [Anaerofustis stercorihominis]MCR2033711.1 hypothetical protein [Anaerofustis stercorihominis]